MDPNKNTELSEDKASASYGGSRYRLSYDKLQKKSKEPPKTSRLGIFLIVISILAALGLLTIWYFDMSLAQIFSPDKDSDTTSGFHSFESGAVTDAATDSGDVTDDAEPAVTDEP